MFTQHTITIIIPCYNSAGYITRCLDSIIKQTLPFSCLEIILIDDCSTDSTLSILEQFENSYPENTLLISLEKNYGQGYARNLALEYASGKYIMFIDSDDAIRPDTLKYLLQQLDDWECDVIEFEFSRNYIDMEEYEINYHSIHIFKISNAIKRRLFCTTVSKYGLTCNKIYLRSLIMDNNIRFAEGLLHEDTLFIELILFYACKYGYSKEKFYYYHNNPNGSMQNLKADDSHQFDRLSVQLQFLAECEQRSLLTNYFDIVETLFFRIYYIDTMLYILQYFSHPPLEKIREMQHTFLACFPNFKENYLLQQTKTVLESYLMDTLLYPINEANFFALKSAVQNIQRGLLYHQPIL